MTFDTEAFIFEIQNRPCLWDSSLASYSDRNLKSKAWDEIVNILGDEEMTFHQKRDFSNTLQKRWKGIRGCFTRELNRQKTLKAGSSTGSRKSEYMYFKQLLFLQKVVTLREPELVASKEPESTDSDPENDLQEDTQAGSCLKRKRTEQKSAPDDNRFFEAKSAKSREQYEVENEDEDRLFMLSLVSTLKKVPPPRKMSTKIKIMSILEEATRPMIKIEDSTFYRES